MELQLVLYDTNEIQYTVKPEELRFTKAFYGGIDLEMSYFLPCSLDTDYLYVGYGQRAELWYGLIRLFLAEQREIEEVRRGTTEGITGRCLGYWAFLDDFCYGEKGKIWCDTRYDQWEIAWKAQHTDYRPRHFDFDQTQHLYLAQEAGEANTDNKYGGLFYRCPYDEIKRVTFDYEAGCLDDNKFSQQLISYDIDWGNANTEWSRLNTGSGSEDITLSTARPILVFRVLDTGRT